MENLTPILPEDIISESRKKINNNFQKLATRSENLDRTISMFSQDIKDKINELISQNNWNNNQALNQIHLLDEKVDGLPQLDTSKIQQLVDNTIANAQVNIDELIRQTAGQQIRDSLIGYVKEDALNGAIDSALSGLDYVKEQEMTEAITSAYGRFSNDASKSQAAFEVTVANSKFYRSRAGEFETHNRQGGYFVYREDLSGDLSNKKGTESEYTSVENFYATCSSADKQLIDNGVTNPGIDNPETVTKLMARCEQLFKTEVIALANIYSGVEGGVSMTQIINAIGDPNDGEGIRAAITTYVNSGDSGIDTGVSMTEIANEIYNGSNTIRAAITSYANSSESGIRLSADRIDIDANHNLTLSAGNDIVINSTNFKVTGSGHITASGIDFTADNAVIGPMSYDSDDGIIYFGANQNTYITSDGTLHARNADIEQQVKAQEFEATITEERSFTDDNDVPYNGSITKKTTMNGESFNIVTLGKFYNAEGGEDEIDVTGNALFIKIVDYLENDNNDVDGGNNLCGVPVLCMRYKGVDYIMKPGSWLNTSQQLVDTSNMRWEEGPEIVKYSVNTSNLQNNTTYRIADSGNYLFRNDKETTYLSNITSTDTICTLTVYSWGPNESTSRQMFSTAGISEGMLGLKSNINSNYIGFNPNTSTRITDSPNGGSCAEFASYKINSLSAGFSYFNREIGYSIPSYSAIENIYNWLKDQFIRNNYNDYWRVRYNSTTYNCQISSGLDASSKNLPFEGGNNYQHDEGDERYQLDISYYPIVTVSNGSYTSTRVNQMWVKCRATISSIYMMYPPQGQFYMYISGVDGWWFNPEQIELHLDFDMILNGCNIVFNPANGEINNVIINYIKNYIKNFDFTTNMTSDNKLNCYASIIPDTENFGTLTKSTFER